MRNPTKVTELIKKCIPVEEKELHDKVDWFLRDFPYKAPEQYLQCWRMLTVFVNTEIVKDEDPLTTDWKVKVVAFLIDKTEEQVRQMAVAGER